MPTRSEPLELVCNIGRRNAKYDCHKRTPDRLRWSSEGRGRAPRLRGTFFVSTAWLLLPTGTGETETAGASRRGLPPLRIPSGQRLCKPGPFVFSRACAPSFL